MSEEIVNNIIREKVREIGYKSVLFRLALIREQGQWKIFSARLVFDIAWPYGHKTLLKKGDFALEDFSLTLEEFDTFLEYLKKVFVGNVKFHNSTPEITDDLLFSLGSYRLCFVGNFPGRELMFFRSDVGKEYHGIDKPLYFIDYAVNDSVRARAYQRIDLTGYDIPLTDPIDAINHFWGTNYQPFQMTSSCPIYLPLFDAHIASCNFDKDKLIVTVDFDSNLVKLDELSLSVIVDKKYGDFRKKYSLKNNRIEINIGFDPSYAVLFLNKNDEKIDEYYYSSSKAKENENRIMQSMQEEGIYFGKQQIPLPVREEESIEPLFDKKLVSELPQVIQSLIIEAEHAYHHGLYRSALILIRSALEEGLTLAITKMGREANLFENGYEMGLQGKIKLSGTIIPKLGQIKTDMEAVKWFGDKASHEAYMPIYKSDVLNTEPKFRLFITKLIELEFNK